MNPVQEETIQVMSQNDILQSLDASAKVQGRWNLQEHLRFLNAIVRYGKDWKKVEDQVALRTGAQVRSHAQKYFLKINKIIKDRKKIKGKKMPDITDTELQLKEYFTCHPLTPHTPKEIIELLKIEKVGIKNIIEESSNGNQKLKIQQLLAPTAKPQKKKPLKVKLIEPLTRIEDVIENQLNEAVDDPSFFAKLIWKNKEFLLNGGSFTALFDFGINSKKQKASIYEQETVGHRKSSIGNFETYALEP